jgi:hypothetical protein
MNLVFRSWLQHHSRLHLRHYHRLWHWWHHHWLRHTDGKDGKNDSTMGKLMEKAGGMLKNENMVEKGRTKREEAGARPEDTY